MREVMRGYQRPGYRFLRTLEEYRLGGILADDMGLGKTLQVIAVFLAARLEGKVRTSLVVAPASLVYNGGEEIGRFAPELTFLLVTGSQEERLEKLETELGSIHFCREQAFLLAGVSIGLELGRL